MKIERCALLSLACLLGLAGVALADPAPEVCSRGDASSLEGELLAAGGDEPTVQACPPDCCEIKTDTKCYGVVLVCNDQYIDPFGNCVRSGEYVCGVCFGLPF